MMKVLIIEDQLETVKGIIDASRENNWDCKCVDFDSSWKELLLFNPDVIILDWRNDADSESTGEDILESIWDVSFRPVIIFSAIAPTINLDEKKDKSKMLSIIDKGSEQPVIDLLKEISLYSEGLSIFRETLSQALIESMNAIEIFQQEEGLNAKALSYVLSKRVSTCFDNTHIEEVSPSWVQYMCPPVIDSLMVCDVIRKDTENKQEVGAPDEYYLILSPSCDMVFTNDRKAKISSVLCAQCTGKDKFVDSCKEKTIISNLNQGYRKNFVPLPGLANILPYMTVDLKKTELIDLDAIALDKSRCKETTRYYRVASIISPFREQIVWAHMQNSCRPGVPDRNMEAWAKAIVEQ